MDNQGEEGGTGRQALIDEYLRWIRAVEDDEERLRRMTDPEFLAVVSDENLRALIQAHKEEYNSSKDLFAVLANRKPDTSHS